MDTQKGAIFLDRDGTLIEDVGFIDEPGMIRLFPDVVPALLELQKKYLLFVVTNQSGIAGGNLTHDQVARVNGALDETLKRAGVYIQQWYVCPHAREDGCACIKPKPAFLHEAANKYRINLRKSFVIGDHPHDPSTADAVGAFGLYLLTGHGAHHLHEIPPERLVFHTFSEAAKWISRYPRAGKDFSRALSAGAKIIRQGGIVAFPTETVYGLGADAFNPEAIRRIFEIKRRPPSDPLIVHISDPDQIERLVTTTPWPAKILMDKFWPGPLTLVLPKAGCVPDVVTAGKPSVAVRMPSGYCALELIKAAGTPVAAPSANLFGRASPTTIQHVEEQFHSGCDLMIDGGACRVGVESTVLSLLGETPVLLRPGGVEKERIEEIIGPVADHKKKPDETPESPGMFPGHYAPVTPLVLVDDISPFMADPDVGKIFFMPPSEPFSGPVRILCEAGSLSEAAANLYYAMRGLDRLGLKLIAAQRAPNHGLGKAVNDRLTKAAHGIQ